MIHSKEELAKRIELLSAARMETINEEPFERLFHPAFDNRQSYVRRFWNFISARKTLNRILDITISVAEFFDPRIKSAADLVSIYIIPKLKK